LSPTHILVQPPEVGVDAHLAALAKENGWAIATWRLNSLDDIETMVRELPDVLFADGTTEFAEASRRSAELVHAMATALSPGDTPLYRGRVLLLYSADPVSVFGQGTYLDGVLRALGATNATTAKDWVTFTLEDIVRIDPQAVIIAKPGSEDINVQYAVGPVWELEIDAIMNRRLAVLAHPDSLLPSTGVIGVAAELRSILEQFEAESP
jgi:ABC-type Fe3+-hydroxamate transport system substrate-binding protein